MASFRELWIKEELRRRKKYPQWQDITRDLVEKGQEPHVAAQNALRRVAPDLHGMDDNKVPRNPAELLPQPAKTPPPKRADEPYMTKGKRAQINQIYGSAKKADFEGHEPENEAEAVRWVAENLHLSDCAIEDAPGPISWGLLHHVRSSSVFRDVFWKDMYSKLVLSKLKEQEDKPRGMDAIIFDDTELLERYQAAIETGSIRPPDPSETLGQPAEAAGAYSGRPPF